MGCGYVDYVFVVVEVYFQLDWVVIVEDCGGIDWVVVGVVLYGDVMWMQVVQIFGQIVFLVLVQGFVMMVVVEIVVWRIWVEFVYVWVMLCDMVCVKLFCSKM